MGGRTKASRVEVIILDPATVELKLYEGIEGKRYRSWKMPRSVATLIAYWWNYQGDYSEKEKRFTNLVISMPSSGHVEVKELDVLGHPKPAGWSLPVAVVKALAKELP
jgi:hypothetical protein